MTQVKICGLTRREDVELACSLGAAYLGFNFAAVSTRRISIEASRELCREVSPGVVKVGVFVAESPAEIREAIEAAGLDLVQIHRPLQERDLELPRPVIALGRAGNGSPVIPADSLLARCRLLLFDAGSPERPGGTGSPFDWSALEGRRWPVPVLLAGGLTPENVGEAIGRVRPAAVDVASGVESSAGIKDESRLRRFFEAVRRADREPGR